MSTERWGDSWQDRAALDAWITRAPENDSDDCLDQGAETECGACRACLARKADRAQEIDDRDEAWTEGLGRAMR